jgi:phosphate uptake regulator
MIAGCMKQKVEEGVLYIDVDMDCLIRSAVHVPVKSVRYYLRGSILTLEVTPDLERILREAVKE